MHSHSLTHSPASETFQSEIKLFIGRCKAQPLCFFFFPPLWSVYVGMYDMCLIIKLWASTKSFMNIRRYGNDAKCTVNRPRPKIKYFLEPKLTQYSANLFQCTEYITFEINARPYRAHWNGEENLNDPTSNGTCMSFATYLKWYKFVPMPFHFMIARL